MSASHTDKTVRFDNLFAPKIIYIWLDGTNCNTNFKGYEETRQLYQKMLSVASGNLPARKIHSKDQEILKKILAIFKVILGITSTF